MLGWNPGTEQELFTLDGLTKAFSLDRVVKSGARFNPDKAKWFNQEYLRQRTTEQLVADFRALNGDKLAGFDDKFVGEVLDMMKERAHFAFELWDLTSFFFEAPQSYDEASVNKFWKDEVKEIIPQVRAYLEGVASFDKDTLENGLHELISGNEWPMGKVMNTLRLFLVGVSKGPGIADMMAILGKQEILSRIDNAIAKLG